VKEKIALGDKFDLADFDDVVLKNSAVPLNILERFIDGFIAETLKNKLNSDLLILPN